MLFEFQLAVQLAELLFQRARHAGVGSFGLGEIDVELGLELLAELGHVRDVVEYARS